MTDTEATKILEDAINAAGSASQLARDMGFDPSTVRRWRRNGVPEAQFRRLARHVELQRFQPLKSETEAVGEVVKKAAEVLSMSESEVREKAQIRIVSEPAPLSSGKEPVINFDTDAAEMPLLPTEVSEDGVYLMTRTDDPEGEGVEVRIIGGVFEPHEDYRQAVETLDPECRLVKVGDVDGYDSAEIIGGFTDDEGQFVETVPRKSSEERQKTLETGLRSSGNMFDRGRRDARKGCPPAEATNDYIDGYVKGSEEETISDCKEILSDENRVEDLRKYHEKKVDTAVLLQASQYVPPHKLGACHGCALDEMEDLDRVDADLIEASEGQEHVQKTAQRQRHMEQMRISTESLRKNFPVPTHLLQGPMTMRRARRLHKRFAGRKSVLANIMIMPFKAWAREFLAGHVDAVGELTQLLRSA